MCSVAPRAAAHRNVPCPIKMGEGIAAVATNYGKNEGGQLGSDFFAGGAVGILASSDGESSKSNISSSVLACWSRAVRYERLPSPSDSGFRNRASISASMEV